MFHQSRADLSAENAADAQQKADFIIHIGQFVVGDQSGYRNNDNGQERCAHRFFGGKSEKQEPGATSGGTFWVNKQYDCISKIGDPNPYSSEYPLCRQENTG